MWGRAGGLWVAVSAAVVLAWVLPAPGAAADAVIDCGSVITEDTVLTQDLRDCENGLVVAAPNVVLDLGGYEVAGRGMGEGIGVHVRAEGVVVRNGTIRGFSSGVAVNDVEGLRVENTTIRGNTTGIVMLFLVTSEIVGNRIIGNTGAGIASYRAGGLVEGNHVTDNGGEGIHVDSGHSAVFNNSVTRNGGDGIFVFDEICGHLNLLRVGGNSADRNGGLGINVRQLAGCPPGVDRFDLLDAGGNSAKNNSDPRECTIVECARNRGQAKMSAAPSPIAAHPQLSDPAIAEALLREADKR